MSDYPSQSYFQLCNSNLQSYLYSFFYEKVETKSQICNQFSHWRVVQYDIWAQLTINSKSEKLLLNIILWRFRQIGKFINQNFIGKKLVESNFVTKNFVCPHHRHENGAYFYVMEAKNGHFSVFWKIDWSKKNVSCSPEKIYDIWPDLQKNSSKSKYILLHKILWRFRQIGKWKFSQH